MGDIDPAVTGRGGAILPFSSRRQHSKAATLFGSPELTLSIGRDKHSSGVSVWLRYPSGGEFPAIKLMLAERWNDPIPGEEGIVEIAIAALQSVLGEIRGIQDPPA